MFRSKNIYWRNDLIVPVCAILSIIVLVSLHGNLVSQDRSYHKELAIERHETNPQRIKRLPSVIIIGARKSGTRALLKFLELNPQIKGAKSEVHFFDRLQNYNRGLDWYRSRMPETLPDEYTVEKSPAYFVTREVPERIKAMNSSIKLVLILRNPVTRLISDFSQIIANKLDWDSSSTNKEYDDDQSYYYEQSANFGQTSDSSVNQTVDLIWQDARKKFEDFVLRPDGGIDEQRQAIRIGMYSIHLERWLAHFSRQNLHIIDGEKLISNPFEELHKLEQFLGLRPVIKASDFVFNPRKGFFCVAKNRQTPERQDARTRRMIQQQQQGSICLSKSKGRRHVMVKDELVEALRNFYEPYNNYLQSLTGIEFDWMNKEL